MKIVVFNLGCKVNQYESDVMAGRLAEAGHTVSEKAEKADIYIINTCAVTAEAEKKSRQAVARVLKLNPQAEVYVCGCASQNKPESFTKKGVRYVSGSAKKELIISLAERGNNLYPLPDLYEDFGFARSPRTRSYIKVQDGCDSYCSYCIIPYLRGRSRSRPIERAVAEAEEAAKNCREIVITGINLSAYGKDTGVSLTKLLEALSSVDARIRLGSLEGGVIDDAFLTATKKLKRFCPHFHLSLQSGDDGVLRAMNRHYGTAEFMSKLELIRKHYPDAAVTTDIITGFPAESAEAHGNTVEFIKSAGFADIHVFQFSPRQGTAAAKLKQLPDRVKEDRAKELAALKTELKRSYAAKFIGRPLDVLFEDGEDGLSAGYSENYIRVYTDRKIENKLETVVPSVLYGEGLKE